jgi:hypothetical protein
VKTASDESAPAKCSHKEKKNPEGGSFLCPCLWVPKKRGQTESGVQYQVYLNKWKKNRGFAAQKHGIKLSAAQEAAGQPK